MILAVCQRSRGVWMTMDKTRSTTNSLNQTGSQEWWNYFIDEKCSRLELNPSWTFSLLHPDAEKVEVHPFLHRQDSFFSSIPSPSFSSSSSDSCLTPCVKCLQMVSFCLLAVLDVMLYTKPGLGDRAEAGRHVLFLLDSNIKQYRVCSRLTDCW